MQMASGTCPQTRPHSLCNTPPLLPHQHHKNHTTCNIPPPARQVQQSVAPGPAVQTRCVYPPAEVTGGERLERRPGNIEEIEGGVDTGECSLWGFLHLITYHTMLLRRKRAGALPSRIRGISYEESESLNASLVCKAQICSVQHASSAFCCCVSAHTLPSTQPKHLHLHQGSLSNSWRNSAP